PERELRTVDEEILLLRPHRREDAIHALVAEQLEELDGLVRERVRAAQERRHLVEGLAVIADEDRRDVERLDAPHFGDEHRTRRIPRRIAAGFPCRAKAAARKAGGVGLALDELRSAEHFDRLS